jgi:hypothetical protein
MSDFGMAVIVILIALAALAGFEIWCAFQEWRWRK